MCPCTRWSHISSYERLLGRNYETFWTQTGLRMTEFSDVPLTLPEGEETYHDIFRAKNVTKYLEDYLDTHVYCGRSLRDRVVLNFPVSHIEKDSDIWIIHRKAKEGQPARCFKARKLMIATGMTSEPNMPILPEQEGYEGLILHQRDFGRSSVLSTPFINQVAIIGAGKSAADMVYAAAKAGKAVSWIIRKSGSGPAAFIDVKGHGAYKNAAEIGHMRLMTVMAPSCFASPNILSRFILDTRLGRVIGRKVWNNADRDILREANYRGRPKALKGYELLEPSTKYAIPQSHKPTISVREPALRSRISLTEISEHTGVQDLWACYNFQTSGTSSLNE